MESKSSLKYLRISPRKVRLVASLIRMKRVEMAEHQLNFLAKKAAEPIRKLLNSAVANAKNNFGIEKSNLYISEIKVDEGPTLKRTRARARGRYMPIRKKMSHIILVLNEINPTGKIKKQKDITEKEITKNIEVKKKFPSWKGRQSSVIKKAGGGFSAKKFLRRKVI